MNTQGLSVTVVGWVATPPKEIGGNGVPYTSFRLATTPRRFDSRAGGWTDGRTEWITVKAFRDVAFNVAASVRKGDPVLVHGRLQTEEWEGESGTRTSLVLEAAALGHDLTRGRTVFARTVRAPAGEGDGGRAAGDADGSVGVEDPWVVEGGSAEDGPDDGAPTADERDLVDEVRTATA